MAKYKCEDCGLVFEGDLSTMRCPNCGSSNIKKAKSGFNISKRWLAIGAAVLGVVGLIIALAGGDDKLEASMNVDQGVVTIEVEGVSATTLSKEYKVIIFDDQNSPHGEPLGFIHKKRIAQYSVMQLMEGYCYTFSIERKDGKPIKNVIWKTSNRYCVPTPPVKPEIDRIESGKPDREALVWNNVRVVMKKNGNFTYTIGSQVQNKPVFNNVKPGSYTVVVRNEEGVEASQSLVLNDIKSLAPPLTPAQVQDIFDKVSAGTISASDAQEKLAEGNVNLASIITPDISTLWGALMEAEMGVKFRVEGFQNDPNTNKIKSGSLRLSKI